MINLRLLREQPDLVRSAYARRGGVEGLERVVQLDQTHRDLLGRVEELRAEQNRASKAIGAAAPDERPTAIKHAKELSDRLKELEPELEKTSAALDEAAVDLPNLPHDSVPDGLTEDDNVVEREIGDKPSFDFEPKEHVELGESLRIFDSERDRKSVV